MSESARVNLAELRSQRFSRWERVVMGDGELSVVEVDATPEVLALVEAVEAALSVRDSRLITADDAHLEHSLDLLDAALAPFAAEAETA
ncbi:MAG TPA: hypothetical protein VLE97_10460 [Gaiellaceae bacterium]|nr:hypothetical protein [Gaiellaceae bacterium]